MIIIEEKIIEKMNLQIAREIIGQVLKNTTRREPLFMRVCPRGESANSNTPRLRNGNHPPVADKPAPLGFISDNLQDEYASDIYPQYWFFESPLLLSAFDSSLMDNLLISAQRDEEIEHHSEYFSRGSRFAAQFQNILKDYFSQFMSSKHQLQYLLQHQLQHLVQHQMQYLLRRPSNLIFGLCDA